MSKRFVCLSVLIFGAIMTVFTACTKNATAIDTSNTSSAQLQSQDTSSNNMFSQPQSPVVSGGKLQGQDITDITKLIIPDELVYLHDGSETVFPKSSPKFQKIINLNNQRQKVTLQALKLAINYDVSVKNTGDYLIYRYTSSNYAPVYFKLVPAPDKSFENFVFNYYFTDLPGSVESDPNKSMAHGHLAPADELLEYIKS